MAVENVDPKKWRQRWQLTAAAAQERFASARTPEELEEARVAFLGRAGGLNELFKAVSSFTAEQKRELLAPANEEKAKLVALLEARKALFERQALEEELGRSPIDPSLPPSPLARGRLHPLTQVMDEMLSLLSRLGFSWADGPLMETEYYNFEALNIPAEHPARDTQDTFYIETIEGQGALLLRTHTSPVQIRRMESSRPPVRIIAPGRVFRHEAVDASHSAVFHQIEGLSVDKNVSMADLKGTLHAFLQALFGSNTATRFRPSYFPFVEPGAEMDIQCVLCGGSGCPACKRSGWMEVLGCGMVHPNVLRAVSYNPELWSGYAFGLGVERIAMLKLGITDIRMFYENDLRFLEQFG